MSLGRTGSISLEHIDPNILGGVSYVYKYYNAEYCPSYYNYLTHKRDHDTYIRYGFKCDRARMFVYGVYEWVLE